MVGAVVEALEGGAGGRGGAHSDSHVIHIEDFTGDETGRDDTREEVAEKFVLCIHVNMYSCCGALALSRRGVETHTMVTRC